MNITYGSARQHATRGGGLALAAVTVIVVLVGSGCSGRTPTSNPSPSTPASATPATTTTARVMPAASGPMTGEELVWLEGIGTLHKAMDAMPSMLTTTTMRSFAGVLGSCTRRLDGLGIFTDRLQPVYEIAKQGCAQYEKGSQCLATAASFEVVVAGSEAERKHTEAVTCAMTAVSDGSGLLAEAEGKGFEIRQAAQ